MRLQTGTTVTVSSRVPSFVDRLNVYELQFLTLIERFQRVWAYEVELTKDEEVGDGERPDEPERTRADARKDRPRCAANCFGL